MALLQEENAERSKAERERRQKLKQKMKEKARGERERLVAEKEARERAERAALEASEQERLEREELEKCVVSFTWPLFSPCAYRLRQCERDVLKGRCLRRLTFGRSQREMLGSFSAPLMVVNSPRSLTIANAAVLIPALLCGFRLCFISPSPRYNPSNLLFIVQPKI